MKAKQEAERLKAEHEKQEAEKKAEEARRAAEEASVKKKEEAQKRAFEGDPSKQLAQLLARSAARAVSTARRGAGEDPMEVDDQPVNMPEGKDVMSIASQEAIEVPYMQVLHSGWRLQCGTARAV